MAGPVQYTDQAGNVLTTPAHIMRAIMFSLAVKPVACQPGVIMRGLDNEFMKGGVKMGDTVWMRLKQYFEVTESRVYSAQDIQEEVIPIKFDKRAHVGFEWDSFVEKRYIQDVMEREVDAATMALTNHLDDNAMRYIGDTIARCRNLDTLGTLVGDKSGSHTGYRAYAKGAKNLMMMGVPTPLHCIISGFEDLDLLVDSMGLYNPAGQIGQNYRSGQFSGGTNGKMAAGINYWYQSGNSYHNTCGELAASATPIVNGGSQTGDSLVSSGWAASKPVLKRGNILAFPASAAIYETNPQPPHRSFKQPMTFVVTEDVTSAASGNTTIPIWPKMIPSGAGQNMTKALPASTEINVYGKDHADFADISEKTINQGCVFHQRQGVLVMGDLPTYGGCDVMQRIRSRKAGVSVRYLRQYFGKPDEAVSRLDIIYGGAPKGTGRNMGYRMAGEIG